VNLSQLEHELAAVRQEYGHRWLTRVELAALVQDLGLNERQARHEQWRAELGSPEGVCPICDTRKDA